MFGNGARSHPEQDKRAGPGVRGRDFWHHPARAFGQHLAGPGLAPIPAVGRNGERFVADNFPPDTAREAEAIAADAAQAGLIVVRGPQPRPRDGDD